MIPTPSAPAVVVDTSVYGELFLQRESEVAGLYTEHLRGKTFVVPFMVVAEIRFWMTNFGERRKQQVQMKLDQAAKEGLTEQLMEVYVTLQAKCKERAHPLFQKDHVADRWIAATAIMRQLPLVAHDLVFLDTPDLILITELRR